MDSELTISSADEIISIKFEDTCNILVERFRVPKDALFVPYNLTEISAFCFLFDNCVPKNHLLKHSGLQTNLLADAVSFFVILRRQMCFSFLPTIHTKTDDGKQLFKFITNHGHFVKER